MNRLESWLLMKKTDLESERDTGLLPGISAERMNSIDMTFEGTKVEIRKSALSEKVTGKFFTWFTSPNFLNTTFICPFFNGPNETLWSFNNNYMGNKNFAVLPAITSSELNTVVKLRL